MIEGRVGKMKFAFLGSPRGRTGEAEVRFEDGAVEQVAWVRDSQGIWIETTRGFFGFDVRKTPQEDGLPRYEVLARKRAKVVSGLSFLRSGEGIDAAGGERKKKGARIKSQMPGKIVRILVKPGESVKKGQALLVMEAMKMENEIRSPQEGVIREVRVTEGQAVETGAELLSFT
jgi:biotin carboxyl carrier protein